MWQKQIKYTVGSKQKQTQNGSEKNQNRPVRIESSIAAMEREVTIVVRQRATEKGE